MSLRRIALSTATLAGLLTTTPAWGWGEGWPEDDSVTSVPGSWNAENIDFGHSLANMPNQAPESMTTAQLTSIFSAPPAEPWCGTNFDPTPAECDDYLDDLDWWIADFLDLESPADIPAGTPIAPPLCPQSCLGCADPGTRATQAFQHLQTLQQPFQPVLFAGSSRLYRVAAPPRRHRPSTLPCLRRSSAASPGGASLLASAAEVPGVESAPNGTCLRFGGLAAPT